MRLLVLSRHDTLGASSRLRTFQYLPFLEKAGFNVVVSPFFDNEYLRALYSRGRRFPDVVRAYRRRFEVLRNLRSTSVVWVEKEIAPFLPAWAEGWLAKSGVPYIVDYDDATFHTYDRHQSPFIRHFLGNKFQSLLGNAHLVTVGNAYLEKYALDHGATHVERIPTVVDITRYPQSEDPPGTEFRIGWIGTPATTKYLKYVREALRQLAQRRPIRLVTIGAAPLSDFGIPLEQHAWCESNEARLLATIHLGIMPLPDEPWERGKCGYKLIQYMACGKPVVASPVGVNRDIVSQDVGFLAQDEKEWVAALSFLAADHKLRSRYGAAARRKVETQYSLAVTAQRLCELIKGAAHWKNL